MTRMDDDYNASQDRIAEARASLRVENDPEVRAYLHRIIDHEMAVWN